MHTYRRIRRRMPLIRRTAAWVGALATLPLVSQVHATRPMITDDAGLIDPKTCQLESWVQLNRDGRETWVMPACNVTGDFEVTLGGGRTRENHAILSTDLVAQVNTTIKPMEVNGWGVGLAGGVGRHRRADGSPRDWYAYVPVSFSFRDDTAFIHTNLGWIREGETHVRRTTWSLGTEVRMNERVWVIAETFGQGSDTPFVHVGARYWLIPNRLQLDATYGNGGTRGERWISIGVRWLTLPFLR